MDAQLVLEFGWIFLSSMLRLYICSLSIGNASLLKWGLVPLSWFYLVNLHGQQSDFCQNIYVWEFSPINGERDRTTRILTDQVEELLTQINICSVLDRRREILLKDRVEEEKAIFRSSEIPQDIDHLLQVQLAERILFGEVHAEYGGNIFLRLTIDLLGTKQILISESIYLEGSAASDPRERKSVLKKLLEKMLGISPLNPIAPTYHTQSFQIRTYTPKAILVKKGDEIVIHPSGSMIIGEWLGTSTPKGKESGLFGFSITRYSFFQKIPHAALLYKFSWESNNSWKYCGEKIQIVAPNSGYLEFNINDNKQGDNSGAYDVKVSILQ